MSVDLVEHLKTTDKAILAKELVTHLQPFEKYYSLKSKEDKEEIGLVDFSYDLSSGHVTNEDANTWFQFDLQRDSLLFNFMKAMYSREVSDEEVQLCKDFLTEIGKIAVENHVDAIRDIVRKAVLPDSDPRTIPLTKIVFSEIELVDYSAVDNDDKRTVNYIKLPGVPVNMQSVTSRIFEVREEKPNVSVNDIIISERKAANPVFDAVMGATLGSKYLWDCHISMFVDYSFSEEFLKIQREAAEVQKEKAKDLKNSRDLLRPPSVKGGKKTIRRII